MKTTTLLVATATIWSMSMHTPVLHSMQEKMDPSGISPALLPSAMQQTSSSLTGPLTLEEKIKSYFANIKYEETDCTRRSYLNPKSWVTTPSDKREVLFTIKEGAYSNLTEEEKHLTDTTAPFEKAIQKALISEKKDFLAAIYVIYHAKKLGIGINPWSYFTAIETLQKQSKLNEEFLRDLKLTTKNKIEKNEQELNKLLGDKQAYFDAELTKKQTIFDELLAKKRAAFEEECTKLIATHKEECLRNRTTFNTEFEQDRKTRLDQFKEESRIAREELDKTTNQKTQDNELYQWIIEYISPEQLVTPQYQPASPQLTQTNHQQLNKKNKKKRHSVTIALASAGAAHLMNSTTSNNTTQN